MIARTRQRRPGPSDRRLADGHCAPGPRHGDRAGTHRVPADLVVGPPDARPVSVLGWDDAFITSLAFSVMLHLGTLVALLVYFRRTGSGSCRPGSPRSATARSRATRTAAWPGCSWRRPSRRRSSGSLFNDVIETVVREPAVVAVTLVVGGIILWLADRLGRVGSAGRGRHVPDRDRHRRGPGAGAHPRHQPVRASPSRRAGSPAWTARPRRGSAS